MRLRLALTVPCPFARLVIQNVADVIPVLHGVLEPEVMKQVAPGQHDHEQKQGENSGRLRRRDKQHEKKDGAHCRKRCDEEMDKPFVLKPPKTFQVAVQQPGRVLAAFQTLCQVVFVSPAGSHNVDAETVLFPFKPIHRFRLRFFLSFYHPGALSGAILKERTAGKLHYKTKVSGMEATIYSRRKKIMVVQHNMTALNSNRQLGITTTSQAKVTEKLSSGYKINRAADDAAGLTISEKMRSQIRGLTQASSNAQDGVSCVQTAEGALTEVHSMLQRMNELAVKSSTGTNTTADRRAIQAEVNALCSEISRVKQSTEFNTLKLLDGSFSNTVQVGAANVSTQRIMISINMTNINDKIKDVTYYDKDGNTVTFADQTMKSFGATGLGLRNSLQYSDGASGSAKVTGKWVCVSTQYAAQQAISKITSAIAAVSKLRSSLGAIQNRLEHTIANLDNIVENTTAAESAIRDTDMAKTMVEYSKNNILQQAGQSMLAQANQSNQGILSLLG